MDEKSLGSRLQQARITAGLTQQSLCQKAGLSYSTLTKIERGAIKSPSIFTIQSIASALGLGLDELMQHQITKLKNHSKSGVSFVYFDVNGCLVHFFHRAFTRLAQISGQSADVVETEFWHYNDQVCRGDMTMHDFNKAFAKTLGLPGVDLLDYYLEAIEPVEPMRELVAWASEHYRVGLLTNIMPGFIDAMRQRGQLPDVPYEVIIDSSEVGAIKPESKIYDIATKRAGCKPGEILFVDDSRMNLMAAEKHGWHVLWFDDYRPAESIKRIHSALELAD